MTSFRALVCLALLSLLPTVVPAAPPAHRAATDWTVMAVVTPDGGVRIGNPRAKAQLVEYGSFTCPHCAAFAKEAYPAVIDTYVRSGRLSLEFRPALRDGVDMVAAAVSRCGGPRKFFGLAEAIYAGQDDWIQHAGEWQQAQAQAQKQVDPANVDAMMTGLAQASGLTAIAVKHGVPPAAVDACLKDHAALDALAKTASDAWNVRQIGGTPAFFLNNDKLDNVYGWAALEPYLRAALKS